METKTSTAIGMVLGIFARFWSGDIAIAIFTAFVTGIAAYFGNYAAKWLHRQMKK